MSKVWADRTRRVAFGPIGAQLAALPCCAPDVAVGGSVSPGPEAALAAVSPPLAPSFRLGLPVVLGTGIPELDELLALAKEAGFAEALAEG